MTFSEYAAFCKRTFGGQRLELGVPRREIDLSQPVLYENTVSAYHHFFGVCPPTDSWPSLSAVGHPSLDGEEGHGQAAHADTSGRRRTLVRSSEEKFRFAKET